MRSGIFGWSYPPGCNGTPFDEDYPCEVCGQNENDCICPECEYCGDVGNRDCYRGHGMVTNEEQRILAEIEKRKLKAEIEAENKYYQSLMTCEHCRERMISDDDEIAAEALCDRCWKEIYEDGQVMGWMKGE